MASLLSRFGGLPPRRLWWLILLPNFVLLAGTFGYHFIEGWSYFDSLYMTVITLTTVGYKEVHDLSHGGQWFTIFLCLGGVFILFYTATEVIRAVITGEFRDILGRQQMERSLAQVHDHFIVCGYGRMGRLVCQEFSRSVPAARSPAQRSMTAACGRTSASSSSPSRKPPAKWSLIPASTPPSRRGIF
jgi:hypothetical protein